MFSDLLQQSTLEKTKISNMSSQGTEQLLSNQIVGCTESIISVNYNSFNYTSIFVKDFEQELNSPLINKNLRNHNTSNHPNYVHTNICLFGTHLPFIINLIINILNIFISNYFSLMIIPWYIVITSYIHINREYIYPTRNTRYSFRSLIVSAFTVRFNMNRMDKTI
eukprot:265747_1